MKKIFLLLVCAVLVSVGFAQEKITGIGKLKLYCSSAVLKEIGYTEEPIEITLMNDYIGKVYGEYKTNNLYALLPDMTLENGIYGVPFDDKVKVYYLPSYTPIEGVNLNGITLKFRNDSLYYINITEFGELEEAFNLKYGKAQMSMEEKERHYTNGYGAKITKVDETFTSTWNTKNKNISCSLVLSKYHNDKGEADYLKYFTLKDTKITASVDRSSEKREAQIKKQLELKKKASLTDL